MNWQGQNFDLKLTWSKREIGLAKDFDPALGKIQFCTSKNFKTFALNKIVQQEKEQYVTTILITVITSKVLTVGNY